MDDFEYIEKWLSHLLDHSYWPDNHSTLEHKSSLHRISRQHLLVPVRRRWKTIFKTSTYSSKIVHLMGMGLGSFFLFEIIFSHYFCDYRWYSWKLLRSLTSHSDILSPTYSLQTTIGTNRIWNVEWRKLQISINFVRKTFWSCIWWWYNTNVWSKTPLSHIVHLILQ